MNLDYSELIDPKKFSIRMTWNVFRRNVIPHDAPRIQVDEMEKAYYAGFTECFKIMSDYASGLAEDDAVSLFERMTKESNAWVEDMLRKYRQ